MYALINLSIGIVFITIGLSLHEWSVKEYFKTKFNIFYVPWVILSTLFLYFYNL